MIFYDDYMLKVWEIFRNILDSPIFLPFV